MPESPETHKEIVEIKKEIRDIKQTQDAELFHDREKWLGLLIRTLDDDEDMMKVLLAVDGLRSANEIEKETGLHQVKCWRRLQKLQHGGVIFKLDDTKHGSPVYLTSRWYRILRLEEDVRKRVAHHWPSEQLTVGDTTNVNEGQAES